MLLDCSPLSPSLSSPTYGRQKYCWLGKSCWLASLPPFKSKFNRVSMGGWGPVEEKLLAEPQPAVGLDSVAHGVSSALRKTLVPAGRPSMGLGVS